MIKSSYGSVEIDGTLDEILADIGTVINLVYRDMVKTFGKTKAKETFDEMYSHCFLTDEEIIGKYKENREDFEKTAKALFETEKMAKEVKEKHECNDDGEESDDCINALIDKFIKELEEIKRK